MKPARVRNRRVLPEAPFQRSGDAPGCIASRDSRTLPSKPRCSRAARASGISGGVQSGFSCRNAATSSTRTSSARSRGPVMGRDKLEDSVPSQRALRPCGDPFQNQLEFQNLQGVRIHGRTPRRNQFLQHVSRGRPEPRAGTTLRARNVGRALAQRPAPVPGRPLSKGAIPFTPPTPPGQFDWPPSHRTVPSGAASGAP